MSLSSFEFAVLSVAVLAYVVAFLAAAFDLARAGKAGGHSAGRGATFARATLLVAFFTHGVLLVARGYRLGDRALADPPSTLLFVTWCATLVAVIIDLGQNMRGLPLFLAPPVVTALGVGAAYLTRLDAAVPALPEKGQLALFIHIVTAIVAYGAFAFAAVLAVMYLFLEGQLRKKRFGVFFDLPALDRLERIGGRFVASGFALLTLSLTIGICYQLATGVLGADYLTKPHTILALVTWVACGVLVALRWRALLAGRRQVVATLIVFALVVATYLGVPLLVGGNHVPA
jgi:ABC-type uncharacterized transport system permease subunit